ncbi:MAG TPA: flagellar motor protein MotD [Steroidobacteraceae bacterium]|jgi:chemotaxis protein MotB|nr:flagellar motor protein MotD [Steroidobacteraceae bacterium]
MRRMRRREEEHENHERWAIPYGDLLTLLLAFFVVMYSISSVNAGKYRVLSDSLYAAFRGEPRTLEPVEVGHKRVGSGADIRVSLVQQAILKGQPRALLAPVPLAMATPTPNSTAPYHAVPPQGSAEGVKSASGPTHPEDTQAAARAQAAAIMLNRVADDVVKAMSGLVKQNLVVVRRKQYWIEVEIRTDILYPSGSARLAPSAIGIIRRLAAVLARFPNPVRVEGFTDNVPIRTAQFYSNWELSAARAGSVVHVLSDRGVARDRLAVVGFGEQHPVASNASAQGRNANRRVTVVILSTAADQHTEPGWMPNTDSDSGAATGQPTADAAASGAATAAPLTGSTPAVAAAPGGTLPAR